MVRLVLGFAERMVLHGLPSQVVCKSAGTVPAGRGCLDCQAAMQPVVHWAVLGMKL